MIDENAFGILIAYFSAENDEYALAPSQFVERAALFRQTTIEYASSFPAGEHLIATDFGHAIYFELAEGEELSDLVEWIKTLRARLKDQDFETVAVLSHGSRWINEDTNLPPRDVDRFERLELYRVSAPSEPLRRALDADGATRLLDETDQEGWGPGLYIDTEAIEAMGKNLKNAPTPLRAGTGTFYRFSR
jgi:hypothetical protein